MATEMSLRVGTRIRQRREELGIRTQRELAEMIPVDAVTNQTINKWETGANEPSARYKTLLAEALQVDIAYFIAEPPRDPTPDPFVADGTGPRLDALDERLARVEQSLAQLHARLDQLTRILSSEDLQLPGVAEILATPRSGSAPARERRRTERSSR